MALARRLGEISGSLGRDKCLPFGAKVGRSEWCGLSPPERFSGPGCPKPPGRLACRLLHLAARRSAPRSGRRRPVAQRSRYLRPVVALLRCGSAFGRKADIPPRGHDFRFWPILLKKYFGGGERNFLEPLIRFVCSDVRDHGLSQKNDHGPAYWRYGARQRRRCPKTSICEIFGVAQFSTFSTVSTLSGHQVVP